MSPLKNKELEYATPDANSTYPFKSLIKDDGPSYRNSNLVRGKVLEYVVYMRNIWF